MLPETGFFHLLPWVLFYGVSIAYIWDSLREYHSGKKSAARETVSSEILAQRERALNATAALNAIILETLDFDEAIKKISSSLPQYLGYETGVLALIDEKRGILRRVGLSETSGGTAAKKVLEKPFSSIEIKLTDKENYCIRAMKERKPLHTSHLYDVVRPALTQENASIIQERMNTKTTLIFPIFNKQKKALGTFLISMSKNYEDLTEFEHQTIKNFIDSVRIALNNATLYTSLEEATVQLKHANQKLKQMDKLKNEFVSVASHELRTPMTAIRSYLWMALNGKGGKLTDKQEYYLQRSYNSVERLIRLINDMLNISRIESGRITVQMQSVDVMKLAQEVIDEVTPHAKELGVNVVLKPNTHVPHVTGDPDKLKEVYFNIIGNALKFTPKDGTVTVESSEKDGLVSTSVTDTGKGVAPDDIDKLFQKFSILPGTYTTNQPAMGTGLGLYICKEIIQMHDGTIGITSEGVGKGSTVTFTMCKYSDADRERLSQVKLKSEKSDGMDLIHNKV